jgi:hypothetical protein
VYKRVINKRNKFYAHDEERAAKVGDVVRIIECRPMSKLKRWRLGEIVRKAVQVGIEPASLDLDPSKPPAGTVAPTTASAPAASAPKKPSGGRKS